MKILINDLEENREGYCQIFNKYGYENNELIFCKSFEESSTFIDKHLIKNKLHIDLIITNEAEDYVNTLGATRLCLLKNGISDSFSNGNFRINSIPIVLYSDYDTKIGESAKPFDLIVQKNDAGHQFFIQECENLIKEWRKNVLQDLESLDLELDKLTNIVHTDFFKKHYYSKISTQAEDYFIVKTKIVSKEFIKCPTPLNYDWVRLSHASIEAAISKFIDTYTKHQTYSRQNNERTILHDFFKSNKVILLRDVYKDLSYEKNLYEINAKNSEECDFILKTEFPDFLKTTFFEVKKEDVRFYVKKGTKRPQLSSNFMSHLEQTEGYKDFASNPVNKIELANKLEYETENFDFVLLAGRKAEKEEMKEKFEKDMTRKYSGITVITYEELEYININYLDKFNRLSL